MIVGDLKPLQEIVSAHGDDLAAIVMEPIRDSEPDEGFIEGVGSLAEMTGAVFIFDEISAGFRLTTGGAHLVLNRADYRWGYFPVGSNL